MKTRKKNLKWMAVLTMALALTFGSSMTAFAYSDETAGTVTITSDEIIIGEPEEVVESALVEDEDGTEDEESMSDEISGLLTPDGNLTLVDDLGAEASEELQFMTVQTRDGSYFYLIVDRSGEENNVYFLNAVDAADLMAMLSEDEQETYAELLTGEDVEEETPILIDEVEEDAEAAEDAADAKKQSNSAIPLLAVFLVLGGAGLAAYYFLKIKPEKEKANIDEELEFDDDEGYEEADFNEEGEDQDENTGENED